MIPYLPARVAAYDGTNREADLNNEVKNCIRIFCSAVSIERILLKIEARKEKLLVYSGATQLRLREPRVRQGEDYDWRLT